MASGASPCYLICGLEGLPRSRANEPHGSVGVSPALPVTPNRISSPAKLTGRPNLGRPALFLFLAFFYQRPLGLGAAHGTEDINFLFLADELFPEGPAKKAARIAGLPKPKGCI